MSNLDWAWVSMLIFDKLGEVCPLMSLNGEDRQVYKMCVNDFKDYFIYLQSYYTSPKDKIEVDGEKTFYPIQITQELTDTKEMVEFIKVWVSLWFKKWQERTKVIFGEMPKRVIFGAPLPTGEFTPEEREDIQRATIDKLIQYGEICCPSILADSLFRKEVQVSERTEWKMQDKINLISRLQRCAREISYTHGPLVFIKPSKEFWGLREFRDDSSVIK